MNDRKVIVVLGMHRSGTSAITKSLELFGVNLGEQLYGASFDNPKGFWEDEECLRINQELLNIDGYEYDSIVKTPDLENEKVKVLHNEAVSVVSKNIEKYKIWAFKDPRTCRYLDFWQSVFDSVGCEVDYVFVSRNPISVAKSLKKRNNLELEKSYLLWAQHIFMSVSSMKYRCLFLDYDDFMDNHQSNLKKISNFLSIEPDIEKMNEYSAEFLDSKLRHTKFNESDILDNEAIPNFVKLLFVPVDKMAKNEFPDYEINKSFLNDSSLNDFLFTCNYIESLERQQMTTWLLLSDKEEVIKEYKFHTAQLEFHTAQLEEKLAKVEFLFQVLRKIKASRVYRLVEKMQGILGRS
ncbi:sulfotransferase family protein [Vibrio fluvialis]|uniref:sulfotransferase family protein n=1 Tax=Vibrio fluvialis TaxID=676 RepID=UPI00096BB55F|nr:hypothetical protein [Vibrio fluvialis]